MPALPEKSFLLESNYVTLPQGEDFLVLVERFPQDRALMWTAAYRAVPSAIAGRRGDYVGVGVLTSDVAVNSEYLYNFISSASDFGLSCMSNMVSNVGTLTWAEARPSWDLCVHGFRDLPTVSKMTNSARGPTCVYLDTHNPSNFISTIAAAHDAEWANEYRKVFVTANLDIMEAMATKGQSRIMRGREFASQLEQITRRSSETTVDRFRTVFSKNLGTGMRNDDTSDLVSIREFQIFRAEIRAEIRKLDERISVKEPGIGIIKNWTVMVIVAAAVAAVVGLYLYTSSSFFQYNPEATKHKTSSIQSEQVNTGALAAFSDVVNAIAELKSACGQGCKYNSQIKNIEDALTKATQAER